jgi:photosystem II stability/assembly factor-like uncharacterized protein
LTKIIIFIFFFILSISVSANDSWRKVTSRTYNTLSDVFFLNETIGWAVGSGGTIIKTNDGGYTWEAPKDILPINVWLYSVYFVDENIGYAGGTDDVILKSVNGGETWNYHDLETIDSKIHTIYFSDINTGWVLTGEVKTLTQPGKSKLLYTNDGGESWSVQVSDTTIEMRALDFFSGTHGVCVGGRDGNFALYFTTDGLSWSKAPIPTGIPNGVYKRTDLYAVGMASNSLVSATGWGSSSAGLQQPSYTIRSTDGGANWTYETQAEKNRLYNNMYDITYKNEFIGISVGGSSHKGGVIYKTIDGGITWEEKKFPFGFICKAITSVNDKVCIIGNGGEIVVSEDFGETWQLITSIPSNALYVIDQIGENTIVAGGNNGAFMKSTDGGNSWRTYYASANNVSPTIKGLWFLNEKIGFTAQKNKTVNKTIDGGKTWTQIMKDSSLSNFDNSDVQFLNEDIGFVVGKAAKGIGVFYSTTNGGESWSTLIADSVLTNELNSLYFFDENHGIVVGNKSVIAITSDRGQSWTKIIANNIPYDGDINSLKFFNDSFGLAGGDNLIKTNTSGKSWYYVDIPNLPGEIYGIAIVSEQVWYLTGNKYLFMTTDAGITWSDVMEQDVVTASNNYDVFIDNNEHLWVSCGFSEIYTTAPIASVDVEMINNNLPTKFSLEQNYPNPFNPSTKINYSIPSVEKLSATSQHVTLKVFDILGREMATLIDERQIAGTYEVEFNASKLSSGIYIYSIQYAGQSKSKKMMLLK